MTCKLVQGQKLKITEFLTGFCTKNRDNELFLTLMVLLALFLQDAYREFQSISNQNRPL